MPLNVFWFIPTQGDGRFLGTTVGGRPATFDYFSQVARAADTLGYEGVLLPTGRGCDDAWVTAAGLAAVTRRLKFLVAVRPGLVSPTLAYRMATTFDRQTRGRILINVVTGGDTDELRGDGLFLSHDERYAQADEFLSIWRGLDRGETVDHDGQHYRVRAAKNLFPSFQPHIPLYFGGSSSAALQVAARHIDLYLTWGEPPQQVQEKIARARELAATQGRELRFGIRLHVIVRDTLAEARRDAEKLIEHITPEITAEGQRVLEKYESDGQKRMLELQRRGRDGLWLRPDLWAGIGLVRGGAGTAMVGDGATVVELMKEYASLGIDTFILSGYPHLEEAYHFAEHVFPRLALPQPGENGRRGEVVANGAVRMPGGANAVPKPAQS
jgi:alkanesulfonate monooxygenase